VTVSIVDGQRYATASIWECRKAGTCAFVIQRGRGTNGELGDAIGLLGAAELPALLHGYAVLAGFPA